MLFEYKAYTKDGQGQDGLIEATSSGQAISVLQKKGLFVSSIQSKGFIKNTAKFKIFGSVSGRDLVFLSRQLAALISAKVSALQVFRMLAEDNDNPYLQEVLNEIGDDIQRGVTISEALSRHPDVFSDFYVNMIKAGEESGLLDSILIYLAEYLERSHSLTSQAKQALIYPSLVMIVAIGVMALVFSVINNNVIEVIRSSGQEIPVYTQIILNISDFFAQFWPAMATVMVLTGISIYFWRQSEDGRRQLDKFKISLPVFGDLYRKLYMSRIADTLHTMVSSGVPMVRALEVASGVVDNQAYRDVLTDSIESIKAGGTLSEAFEKHPEIARAMVQITKVGEESGNLASVLKTLARFYQREFVTTLRSALGLIEPVMIVVLGVWVAIILMSILVPIYNVATSAGL